MAAGKRCFPAVFLQRKIMLIVFPEVQCFGLRGNTLAGIILEFTAFVGFNNHSALDTQNLFLADFGTVGTVRAGMGDFLSEQHCFNLT